jgi:hypothetical protein
MVASHNQSSVERAVAGMAARGLPPRGGGVYFGQLLGEPVHTRAGGAGLRIWRATLAMLRRFTLQPSLL